MKILITGGAGFIGSALIRYLISKTSHVVMNIDKLTYAGNEESVAEVLPCKRYGFKRMDICEKNKLEKMYKRFQPDAVMHLAAESHVDRSIDGPGEFIQTNIVGTYTVLEVTRGYFRSLDSFRRDKFRFLHVSTDEVFGDLGDSIGLFTEDTPYAPSSPYAASKASSDHLVRAWHRTFGIPTIVTNCSNNYGPYQYPEKLIPTIILNGLERKSIPVYGEGNQVRDWLYVDDHARALVKSLELGSPGETYNIGGNNEKKNIEVVEEVCSCMDELRPLTNVKYSSLIEHVEDRPGHDARYAIDPSKALRELDWKALESFESGIRKTVSWYLEHVEWIGRVQGINNELRLGRLGLMQSLDKPTK